jgi:hypothetical protein
MDVTGFSALHVFVTTPGVIGIVCSAIAGVIAGLVALQVTPAMTSAIWVGLAVGAVSAILFIVYAKRDAAAYLARMIRFQQISKPTGSESDRTGTD